jgi:predicted membrane protein
MSDNNDRLKPRYILGAVLILIAISMFFNNIGFGFMGALFGQWPLGLVIVGIILLFNSDNQTENTGSRKMLPFFLIGFGGILFLAKHHVINFSVGAIIVPMILFMVGLHILRSNDPLRKVKKDHPDESMSSDDNQSDCTELQTSGEIQTDSNHFDEKPTEGDCASKDRIDVFCILGGGDYSTRSQNLVSGSVLTILGGAEIDLRDADTQQQQLVLDVFALMGGAVVKIPPHWQVTVSVLPLLGGISNKTTCLADKMNLPRKELLVTGVAFMGGLEIRN